MASKGCIVYLGFLDEQVNSKNEQHLSYSTSKVGGIPNWCVKDCEIPSCSGCRRKMLLVLQIYAPFENSYYHRTLYVFACITPSCWNSPHSWICLRSQVLDSKSNTKVVENAVDDWWGGEEDWSSSEYDDGNGNICPSSQLMLEYMALKAKVLNETDTINDNLNQRKTNSNSIVEVVRSMENHMNLNEGDTNANEGLCGAVGIQETGITSMEASAIIEGPEGDMIAVETPEKPITDIPALFKEVAPFDPKEDATFISYFIGTGVEPPEDTSFSEHERELLLRYTHSTGHDLKEEDYFSGASEGQGGDSVYEKCAAHHGDILLHKFKKRVLRSPQQILRYSRDESASPLWLRPPKPSPPKLCESCGGRLTCEAQIMPQLISYLRVKDVSSTVLEFGTVVLYTCLSACWKEGDKIRREFCYVQGEDV